ncbi:hypothetical protein L6164_015567 [Bauhinia variegata]|uniref:Uncharacterized protein n=1 Tax=Bauhinia variegata TaxID=167791 RepID=A0ACB9NN12_BAUVA|nr:hypothetical protein L6164_015567 [Bauhinia variegata]
MELKDGYEEMVRTNILVGTKARIRRADPKTRATTHVRQATATDEETETAAETGLGAGASAASTALMTERSMRNIAIVLSSITLVRAIAAGTRRSHSSQTLQVRNSLNRVAAIAQNENLGKRLAHGCPFLEAKVAYCACHECCESVVDFIARRSRLTFLDTDAAGHALPRVIETTSTKTLLACSKNGSS